MKKNMQNFHLFTLHIYINSDVIFSLATEITIFGWKMVIYLSSFAQNIDCRYSLELPK